MRWTKQHSKNAVTAKARLRMERGNSEPTIDKPRRIYMPRRAKPDFIIRIEDRFGERVQFSIVRYMGRVMISNGIKSTRQLCRGIEQLLTKSA